MRQQLVPRRRRRSAEFETPTHRYIVVEERRHSAVQGIKARRELDFALSCQLAVQMLLSERAEREE